MALFLFTKAILEGHAINVFNNGKMMRDFTYIDDVADTDALRALIGFAPTTPVAEGIGRFVAWYRSYYGATAGA